MQKKVHKPTATQKRKAQELFLLAKQMLELHNVKEIRYVAKYGMRVPYAYTVLQSGKQCRHRNKAACTCMRSGTGTGKKAHRITCAYRIGGPMCGDIWELATYDLKTRKLIEAKCYVNKHVKPNKRK